MDPERRRLWAVGDVQGFLAPFQRVLQEHDLVDDSGRWIAGGATLVVVGDLVDRGPDGVGVIDSLMRLQQAAAERGGRVVVLIGNHDIQLLAARNFGDAFTTAWLEAGGVPHDLDALSDAHATWLRDLPAVVVDRDVLFMHADAMFYLEFGATVAEVNAEFRRVLEAGDPVAWKRLLARFEEHRAFVEPDGEANLEEYLQTFGVRQVVHGHTPVPRMLRVPPETVTAAYVYCGGRCVNVDPGIYLGGPGFAYLVAEPPPTIAR
ncbi:MAG: metallophosphoesterase [Chloroflexi bacterium]|nr:metallophosphoesterase [Chloroflexota bacterium]